MGKSSFALKFGKNGVSIDWAMPNGLRLSGVPLRVRLRGTHLFQVWNGISSGEDSPVWAEPDLDLAFFGSGSDTDVEPLLGRPVSSWRITGRHQRAQVSVELQMHNDELCATLTVSNPQVPGAHRLPLGAAELQLGNLDLGKDGFYQSALPYGGRTHGWGLLREIEKPGMSFVHGCIGLTLPLVCLHSPGKGGVQFEFMMQERPQAWLRPERGGRVTWAVEWGTERLLEPGQQHAYPGELRITPYVGRPVEQLWNWRDAAAERYGLVAPKKSKWIRHANITHYDMNPEHNGLPFKRLDDPRVREMLAGWRAKGYNLVFAISDNHVGQNWLSPFDYDPRDDVGGVAAEKQMLDWAHELGLRVYLWMTTVGIDRDSPEVKTHPDWFTHRLNGEPFYAWDSNAKNNFLGYAPDADPLSRGWREWLLGQIRRVIGRGYDAIFIDGCIPRASNHLRWYWPGESRNSVEDQVRQITAEVRALGRETGRELFTIVEDNSLAIQACGEITVGRYSADWPYMIKAAWDFGMGGGPEASVAPPARIATTQVRDYLLVRYGSQLPKVLHNDSMPGYSGEQNRPWVVQAIFCGTVPTTDSNHILKPPLVVEGNAAKGLSGRELDPEWRRVNFENSFELVRLSEREPLLREFPLSIEGVRIHGDPAVIGIIRPSAKRCLLALVNFTDIAQNVRATLAPMPDIPPPERTAAARAEKKTWNVREIIRSPVDPDPSQDGVISAKKELEVTLAPYGYRLLELKIGKR